VALQITALLAAAGDLADKAAEAIMVHAAAMILEEQVAAVAAVADLILVEGLVAEPEASVAVVVVAALAPRAQEQAVLAAEVGEIQVY
jgi:hypothetical protein